MRFYTSLSCFLPSSDFVTLLSQILWDEFLVPSEMYTDGCLALPKLNLQFLTMFDYLLRNLNLFHMESTYEIRQVIDLGMAAAFAALQTAPFLSFPERS